jgi:murein DD-endopeptidase MepM/ murein hydrolase activator NlpD
MACLPALVLAAGLAAAPQAPLTVTHAARALRPGELVVLTITAPASHRVTVRAFNRDWPVHPITPRSWRSLVGIDLGTRAGRHDVLVVSGDARTSYPLIVRTRAFPTRRLTVDPALVTPPPEARERIEREARELAAAWDSSAPEALWSGQFIEPVPDPANSAFGTHSVYNGERRSQHSGADFASPTGRPVKAPNNGRVVLAGSRYFTGDTVLIDHGQGLFSLMAHLSEIDVKPGDRVAAGDVVGKVGATGRVTGPHLHWTVRLNGARIDPLSLLHALGAR